MDEQKKLAVERRLIEQENELVLERDKIMRYIQETWDEEAALYVRRRDLFKQLDETDRKWDKIIKKIEAIEKRD